MHLINLDYVEIIIIQLTRKLGDGEGEGKEQKKADGLVSITRVSALAETETCLEGSYRPQLYSTLIHQEKQKNIY